ncbi:hypothetical protein JCM1841_000628 [Sporobolomyces salmonicolor]
MLQQRRSPASRPASPSCSSIAKLLSLSLLGLLPSVVRAQATSDDAGSDAAAPLSYRSSSIIPPSFNVLTPPPQEAIARGLLTFVGVRGSAAADDGHLGPYIVDDRGELVWYGGQKSVLNFGTHEYKGEKVIAFYTGSEEYPGYGRGQWQLYDSQYEHVATVEAQNTTASATDPHDFSISRDGTAVVELWRPRQVDLRPLGDNELERGWAFDCIIQEIDIETNELLFEWHALDHIPVEETFYQVNGGGTSEDDPFDSHHLNAVSQDDVGNFLISLRGSSTVYYIDRETGMILWRLGGRYSDFEMGPGTPFHFQHHARLHGSGLSSPARLTLFSNGANQFQQVAPEARGLILSLNMENMVASLEKEYLPSFHSACSSEGSMQILGSGNVVVGWGIVPYFSEFSPNGTLVHDVQFGQFSSRQSNDHSYRVYKDSWVGRPLYPPSFALDPSSPSTAYASWNGATEVDSWHLLVGTDPEQLYGLEYRTNRTGFETTLESPELAQVPYVAVAAYDVDGQIIGVSEVVERETGLKMGVFPDVRWLWWQDQQRRVSIAALCVMGMAGAVFFARRRGLFKRDTHPYAPLLTTPAPSPDVLPLSWSSPAMCKEA